MTSLPQLPARCGRCRAWAGEPGNTLRAGNSGALWGWCLHPHIWEQAKNDCISGDKKIDMQLGVRTRAETVCPAFVRKLVTA